MNTTWSSMSPWKDEDGEQGGGEGRGEQSSIIMVHPITFSRPPSPYIRRDEGKVWEPDSKVFYGVTSQHESSKTWPSLKSALLENKSLKKYKSVMPRRYTGNIAVSGIRLWGPFDRGWIETPHLSTHWEQWKLTTHNCPIFLILFLLLAQSHTQTHKHTLTKTKLPYAVMIKDVCTDSKKCRRFEVY